MKNSLKFIIIGIVVVLLIVGIVVVLTLNGGAKSNLGEITSAQDLVTLVDKVYEGKTDLFPSLATQEIDVTDKETVKYMTGVDNNEDFEYIVVSEPMVSSQAYSFILAKVKSSADANKIAKDMLDNINIRKWVCVSAEKVYATNSGDVICLVMSEQEIAKDVYDSFKALAGNVGQEYERTEEEIVLPEDMLL